MICHVFGSIKLKLNDLCLNICSGGTPNTNNNKYYNGEIPWLRTQEVDFCNIYKTDKTITKEGLNNSSAKWIKENCVIIAMYGATVGKVAINKIPLTTNQACCNLEINNNIVLYKYIYYYLVNKYEYIKSLGQGSQTNINADIVKNLEITFPSLERQQEIVDILDKFEEYINSIDSGLKGEIDANHQRYEYYRDKLLNFKK